jgi:CubicO group peptidase (beta-lactamase class C family)
MAGGAAPEAPVSADLDWPVAHGGTAVVTRDHVERHWVAGTHPDTPWGIASVTKLLSTMATLAATEAGHLDLDQPVDDEGATVRHLLAHASGLPQTIGQGRRRPVGERRVYSNAGFRLLGEVVADAVGTSFPAWLASSVLDPLGMGSTRLATYEGREADPAAGAVTTMADLVKLAKCLLERGAPVVTAALFAEATTVQFPGLAGLVPGVGRFDPNDWGLGFELHDDKRPHWMGERRSPASFGHFGASGCFLWVDPDAELAAVGVSNRPFEDGRWGMTTWPAWSDALPASA